MTGLPTILGIPFDGQSSYLRGTAEAPMKIRDAMNCDAGDLEFSERTLANPRVSQNEPTIEHPSSSDVLQGRYPAFEVIEDRIARLIDQDQRPVSLGGDHSITYPIVKAFAQKYPELTVFHFDAHPDLYDEFEGNRLSHACPFARIMESGLAKRLVQVGIRTATGHQREQAKKFGVEMVEMRSLPAHGKLMASGPVYISFDMDVLDPAFVPGVSHREPGGMTVREAIAHLLAVEAQIVGADVVEYNPVQDIDGMTAIVAAKIVKEILGKMIVG